MTVSECVWADWRGLIECEINKVSHSALQRPLNDLYEEDHQGFDGFAPGMKVVFAFGLRSPSFSLYIYLFVRPSSNPSLSLCTCLSIPFLLICLFFVSIRLSSYLSVYLSPMPCSISFFVSITLSVFLPVCQCTRLLFRPSHSAPACLAICGCNYQLYIWWVIVLFTHCHKLVKHGHQF